MEHQTYFDNLDEIENKWRNLKHEGFSQKLRDEFWGLCMKGQELFWQMAISDRRNGYSMVKTVPAFQRSIMLLEYEQRYKDAIRMCEEANKWGINTDWYFKRIEKLSKKI
ncbi:hypothetical protein K8R20_02955 [bacterium]|nr:hypothetical protein [bacterium]